MLRRSMRWSVVVVVMMLASASWASITGSISGEVTDKSGAVHALPLSDISSAKLLLTDKLINATAPLSTEGADSIQTIEE